MENAIAGNMQASYFILSCLWRIEGFLNQQNNGRAINS